MAVVSSEIRSEIAADTSIIYDTYARLDHEGQLPKGLHPIRCAGVVAAMLEQEELDEWPTRLDAELATRGIRSHYAELDRKGRRDFGVAAYRISEDYFGIKKARTVQGIVRLLREGVETV